MLADIDPGTLTAWGTWALVAVTIAAVIAGAFAAKVANDTFRLEAEPKIVARSVREANIFAIGEMWWLRSSWTPGVPVQGGQYDRLGPEPVYLVTGRPGEDGRELVGNGFAIRQVSVSELNRKSQAPVWPAHRIEVQNVGRSPAVQVGLKWIIRGNVFSPDWRQKFSIHGPEVIEQTDGGIVEVDGVAPSGSTTFWLGNATGTHLTLQLTSPGYQRDPRNLESGRITPLSTIATSQFTLAACSNNVDLPA